MIATASPALLQALALMRAPRGPRLGAGERLPAGALQLVRIAAGEEEALLEAQASTGQSPQTLRDAAIFYIQQVFFAPGSNSYRVLGADVDITDERLREHYRWLARWLHPDRNPDQWEVVFAERVNAAWQDLRTPERRARYQPAAAEPDEWSAVIAAPPVELYAEIEALTSAESKPRDLRWVPPAVIATLGSVAIALIVLFYTSQRANQAEPNVIAEAPLEELPARLTESTEANPQAEIALAPTSAPSAAAPPVPPSEVPVAEVVPPPVPPSAPPSLPSPAARTTESPAPKVAPVAPIAKPPSGQPPRRDRQAAPVAIAVSDPVASSPRPPASPAAMAASEPAAPVADAPNPPEAPLPGSRDANRLLGQLSRAYEAGDIQGMRALFAADARGPRGDLKSIMDEYRRVFADSSERSLSVRDVSCFVSGDTFTIVATFEANVTSERPTRTRKTRGDLRLDLRREGERWQIFRMQHGERQG